MALGHLWDCSVDRGDWGTTDQRVYLDSCISHDSQDGLGQSLDPSAPLSSVSSLNESLFSAFRYQFDSFNWFVEDEWLSPACHGCQGTGSDPNSSNSFGETGEKVYLWRECLSLTAS